MYQQTNRSAPPRQNSGFVNQQPADQPVRNGGNSNPPARNSAPMQPVNDGYQRAPYPAQHEQQRAPAQTQAQAPAPANYGSEKPKGDRPEWWLQINSYGSKCAFQVENSTTKDGWFTINIESAARENPNDQSNKRYLWNQKTVLQMTRSELPIFCAVMLGMLPSARFDLHGSDAKFFEVENQGKHLFFKTGGQGKNLHVAPVPITDAFMFGTMALTQYARNFNGLTTDSAMNVISRMADQLYQNGGYKVVKPR